MSSCNHPLKPLDSNFWFCEICHFVYSVGIVLFDNTYQIGDFRIPVAEIPKTKPIYENNGYVNFRELEERAEKMRQNPTLSESIAKKILEPLGFKEQFIIFPYITDFFNPETHFVIEINGSSHQGREIKDKNKESYLRRLGNKFRAFEDETVIKTPDLFRKIVEQELG